MFEFAWLLFALPAAGALINLFIGHRLNKLAIGAIASGAVGLSFLVAVGLFAALLSADAHHRVETIHLWDWITIGTFHVSAALLIDPLSVTMALVITGVGFLIHVYATEYMDHDERYQRFFIYLNFFIFAMLILVLSDSFLGMFVGWEGVGLASFLLIGFWFDKHTDQYGYYADAGKKAFLVNRIGDFGMIVAMIALWSALGSLTFLDVFEHAESGLSIGIATLVCFMLLLGATGKSAQLPLYIWLPDAMAGPTPVSALIHAATMVTAGIYMIARTHVLWHIAESASITAAWIGGLTALLAATIAVTQTDLKKILAYSTVSQLGYMMLGVGVGAYGAAVFHLVTHAFFKALLFLAAGSVMHAVEHEMGDKLDIRRMGGLRRKMPTTFWTFMVGSIALAGIPIFSGFFSKDAILLGVLAQTQKSTLSFFNYGTLYVIGLITALLTAFYSFRAVFVPFFGEPRDEKVYAHAHESKPRMTIPLQILAVLAIVGGFINLPFVLTLEHWLEPSVGHHTPPSNALEILALTLSFLIGIFGLLLAYSVYRTDEKWGQKFIGKFSRLQVPAENKWYIDEFYANTIIKPIEASSRWLARTFDQGIVDGIVNGIGSVSFSLGDKIRPIQNGAVPTYALSIFVGVLVVLVYFVFA